MTVRDLRRGILVVVCALVCAAPATVRATTWWLNPCSDLDNDHIDDALENAPAGTTLDVVVEYDPAAPPDTVTMREQVTKALDTDGDKHASIAYLSALGRVFVYGLHADTCFACRPFAQTILSYGEVVALRALERYSITALPADSTAPPAEAPISAHEEEAASPSRPGAGTRVYIVGSGLDDRLVPTSWGFSTALDSPTDLSHTHNPSDVSTIAHDTFLTTRAESLITVWTAPFGVRAAPHFYDVQVTTPQGATTLLEIHTALEAIANRERQLRGGRDSAGAVVYLGVDAGGIIANHTIVWTPNAAGGLAQGKWPRIEERNNLNAIAGAGSPCTDPLEPLYASLDALGVVLVAGAGNDGTEPSYPGGLINPVGLSPRVLVASALNTDGFSAAPYCNWALAPDGAAQNNHPDVGVIGQGSSKSFPGLALSGTSVAAADLAAAIVSALEIAPQLTRTQIRHALATTGPALTVRGAFYGAHALDAPAFLAGALAFSSDTVQTPATVPQPPSVPLVVYRATPSGNVLTVRAGDGVASAGRRLAVVDVRGRLTAWMTLDASGRGRWAAGRRGLHFAVDPSGHLATTRLTDGR